MPHRPKDVVAGVLVWLASLAVLLIVFGGDEAGGRQVLEEVRWGLSAVGAFVVLVVGSFLVHLVAAPPQLESEAVHAGIAADRASRLKASVRAIDHRLMEGVRLRERLDHRSAIDTFGEGWASRLALWQRQCRRTVRHCAPDQYPVFQANVGSDVRIGAGLLPSYVPSGNQAQRAREVIQQWLHALGEVRDAL